MGRQRRKGLTMKKTYHHEQDGIRVDGCANKTDARKAWEAKRAEFAKVSAECRPWVFNYRGHVCIVAPLVDGWEYTIVSPDTREGLRSASCYYGAASQVAAIADALGALAQNVWTREVADDAAMFDDMVKAARMFPAEIAYQRDNFLHVVAHWRAHVIAA